MSKAKSSGTSPRKLISANTATDLSVNTHALPWRETKGASVARSGDATVRAPGSNLRGTSSTNAAAPKNKQNGILVTPELLNKKEQAKQVAVITSLFSWYDTNGRHDLPWRKTQDPYSILISELMLQQTQVPRVVPKYRQFLASFPTFQALAGAERTAVLQHWQGLGYNSRAARLHSLAKVVAQSSFPQTREHLLKLPGIGPYTAGAIVIFAHGKPAISIDVNVERVLKRVFWTKEETPTKRDVEELSLQLITQSEHPRHWHAALMDLGSAICTARNPKCDSCPLAAQCSSKGVRPEEIRIKPKQSRFLGSNRWWRGQILKALLREVINEKHLLHRIKELPTAEEQDMYDAALEGMIKEGLVVREKKAGKRVLKVV